MDATILSTVAIGSENNILASVKKNMGLDTDRFDEELLRLINQRFDELREFGIEPPEGFPTIDATTTWEDVAPQRAMPIIKAYVKGIVRITVDPPLALLR